MEGNKIKFNIIDNMFSYSSSIGGNNIPALLEWDRDFRNIEDEIFITDSSVNRIQELKKAYPKTKINALLIESPTNTVNSYLFVMMYASLFDKIFTCSNKFANISNAFYYPVGGCWVPEKERGIYTKSKLISMFCSEKQKLPGHIYRHIIKQSTLNLENITVEGFGNGFDNHVEAKLEGLKDYAYQIVIENGKEDYYFTEKLIDCFQTGTIPIYWGSSNFFDQEGIYTFDTLEQLMDILSNISFEDYNSKIEHIRNNFEISKEFIIPEDYIARKYYGK